MSRHICHHQDAGEKIKCYGFPGQRFSWGIAILLLTLLAAVITWYASSNNGTNNAGGVLAIGAALLTYQQWRAARTEASLEKFYERLNITNGWLIAALKAEINAEAADNNKLLRLKETEYGMYFFSEADNLEYVIEKYKLGYIDKEHAARGADTFRDRCRHAKFRVLIEQHIDHCGYQEETKSVARRLKEIGEEDEKSRATGRSEMTTK